MDYKKFDTSNKLNSNLDGVSSDLDTFFTNHVGFANVNKTISELAVNSTITIPINHDRMPKFIMIDAFANTTPTFSMFKGSVSSSSASGGLMVQRHDGNITGLGTTTQCVNLSISASLTLILTVKSVTKDNIVLNVNKAANSPLVMYINVTCFD